ncbi:MAG TPA: hypothetical protein VNJ08_13285 [Bacteriovoracaceae bacterium]|nr:hypothetical protein [Bacteriovoracaceae bacterium]
MKSYEGRDLNNATIYLLVDGEKQIESKHYRFSSSQFTGAMMGGAAGIAVGGGSAMLLAGGILGGIGLGSYYIAKYKDKNVTSDVEKCASGATLENYLATSLKNSLMGDVDILSKNDGVKPGISIFVRYKVTALDNSVASSLLTYSGKVEVRDENQKVLYENLVHSNSTIKDKYSLKDMRQNCSITNTIAKKSSESFTDMFCDQLNLNCRLYSIKLEESVWAPK